MNIHYVTTSFYYPRSNGLIERYHRTVVDVTSKKATTNGSFWDLYLNQALAAIRFGANESTRMSPFFLLCNREVLVPIDNLLKPRRKNQGEDPHKIALEQQHKAFLLVRQYGRKTHSHRFWRFD